MVILNSNGAGAGLGTMEAGLLVPAATRLMAMGQSSAPVFLEELDSLDQSGSLLVLE